MFAAGAVAALTANVPLGDLACVNVVVHGMAAVAERAGGAAGVFRRIVRHPPIGVFSDVVFAPLFVFDFPLCAERVVIIADFREVALFPKAAVNEGDLPLSKRRDRVGGGIGEEGVRVFAGIANDVGHGRVFPAVVKLGVALSTGGGADVMSGGSRGEWLLQNGGARQPPDVENKLPGTASIAALHRIPGRHAGELDAVFDDVVELAVGQALGGRGAQVRHARIEMAAEGSGAASVCSMARRAASEEKVARGLEIFGRRFKRGVGRALSVRNRKVANGPSDGGFEPGRLGTGAKSAKQDKA